MASRTFNRAPMQVNTPNSGDIKNYFFNHYNWKGVDKNKNFLAVDQETFADSNNVYVNGEGILRSRPSIKNHSLFNDVTNINDIWTFDDIVVILHFKDNEYVLSFYTNNGVRRCDEILNSSAVKLYMADNKLFIFTEYAFRYFDKIENVVADATDFIYVPKVTFDAAGVKTDVESTNLLTNEEIYVYLYNKETGISPDAYNKNLTITIQGVQYTVQYDYRTPTVIADVKFKIPDGASLIVSPKDTFAIYDSENRTIAYSSTGSSFTKVFYFDSSYGDILGTPKFSQNGAYLIVATAEDIYIVSVLIDNSTGELRFPNFTSLYDVTEFSFMYQWPTTDIIKIVFDFVDYDDFVIAMTDLNYDCYVYRQTGNGCVDNVIHSYDYLEFPKPVVSSISYDPSSSITDISNLNYDGVVGLNFLNNGQSSTFLFDLGLDVTSAIVNQGIVFSDDIKVLQNRVVSVTSAVNTRYTVYTSEKTSRIEIDYTHGNVPINTRISDDGSRILTKDYVYFLNDEELLELVVKPSPSSQVRPVAFTDYIYYIDVNNNVYTSNLEGNYEYYYIRTGESNYILPLNIVALNAIYISLDNLVYISEYRTSEDGDFLWYFPTTNRHAFDKSITKLYPLTTSEMGVFFEDSTWFIQLTELGYTVTKSKLNVGLKSGSDIVSSDDGSKIIFVTTRGLVALGYQDFVASTDQVISYLSDSIYDDIVLYSVSPVKLFKHDFWLIVYRNDVSNGYVFDMRNGSWWPMSYDKSIINVILLNEDIVMLCNERLYRIDKDYNEYYDYDGERKTIDWSITSQRLHLSAINYYKHIVNITLSSVGDSTDPLTMNLNIQNYRKSVDQPDMQQLSYTVDVLRTFVKRLNYFKVNEFQYTLKADLENRKPLPLSISNITIKYKLAGEVR